MREKTPLRRMTAASVFAALIAVLSQLAIPTPSSVPLTLQTFAVVLAGACLGPLWGAISAAVYLALGVLGAPVFAGFGGTRFGKKCRICGATMSIYYVTGM